MFQFDKMKKCSAYFNLHLNIYLASRHFVFIHKSVLQALLPILKVAKLLEIRFVGAITVKPLK